MHRLHYLHRACKLSIGFLGELRERACNANEGGGQEEKKYVSGCVVGWGDSKAYNDIGESGAVRWLFLFSAYLLHPKILAHILFS